MKRTAFLVYGLLSYLAFFATFLYTAGFLTNLFVPKSIDSGVPGAPGLALIVDLALLGVFAIQHSVMARPGFKRWWTKFVPEPLERSTYVLLSSVALWLLFAFWQPLPGVLIEAAHPVLQVALLGLFVAGLGLVFVSTVLIDHFDLFGLRQVVLYFRGTDYTHKPFTTPSLYAHVRHPLYWGWFLTVWATPSMTVGHLLFAAVCTAYILIAVRVEERDLVEHFGDTYRRYQARVPRFLPRPKRTVPAAGEVLAG